MPANLPPEYYEAEKLYKEAQDTEARIPAKRLIVVATKSDLPGADDGF